MSRNSRNPISWVPTVYFAMGLPFVVLNMVSVLMFKGLGIDDAQIALMDITDYAALDTEIPLESVFWRCSKRRNSL